MKRVADVEPSRLRDVRWWELGVRFGFGAGISLAAGMVSLWLGTRVGGAFLAFPAILPATATLVEKKESTRAAGDDVSGAVAGAVGLLAFAWLGVALFTRVPPGVTLIVAALGWVLVGNAAYFGYQAACRMRRRGTSSSR